MKKLLTILMVMTLAIGSVSARKCCFGGMSLKCSGCTKKATPNETKAKRYEQYAKDYENKAAAAEKRGDKKLAEAFRKCAAAKRKIAKGYATGDKEMISEGYDDYKKACKERDKLKASKYEEYAKDYEKKAEEAQKKGMTDLAEAYKKCAEAKRQIAEGYREGNWKKQRAGFEAYKEARKQLKNAMGKKK